MSTKKSLSKTKPIRKVIYKVVEISDGVPSNIEIKMEGSDGTKLRFHPDGSGDWVFRSYTIGNIPRKAIKFIIDDWYVGAKSMNVKLDDFVTINYRG